MASVRKRKWTHKGVEQEAWIVVYADSSGRHQKTFEKKKDADRYRTQVEAEIMEGAHVARSATVTFDKAADGFIADCERRRMISDGMTRNTVRNYNQALKPLLASFGATLVTELRRKQVQDWFDQQALERKRRTLTGYSNALTSVLKFCIRQEWLKRHEILDDPLRLPRASGERVRVPTRDEIVRLLTVAGANDTKGQYPHNQRLRSAVVMLGIFAGLRRGEMAGLQWENVDFENSVIHVRHSLNQFDGLKLPKTRAGQRAVPMAEPVRRALLSLLEYWSLRRFIFDHRTEKATKQSLASLLCQHLANGTRPKGFEPHALTGFVLRTSRDDGAYAGPANEPWANGTSVSPMNLTDHHWLHIMRAANLATEGTRRPLFTMHAMRHAAASLLIEAGLPALNLKALIGHASIQTTYDVYGHLFPDDERAAKAVSSIAGAFQAATSKQEPLTLSKG